MFSVVASFTNRWLFYHRNALEEDDDLEKVLKKAFLDVDKALHTHLCLFNDGKTESKPSFFSSNQPDTLAVL